MPQLVLAPLQFLLDMTWEQLLSDVGERSRENVAEPGAAASGAAASPAGTEVVSVLEQDDSSLSAEVKEEPGAGCSGPGLQPIGPAAALAHQQSAVLDSATAVDQAQPVQQPAPGAAGPAAPRVDSLGTESLGPPPAAAAAAAGLPTTSLAPATARVGAGAWLSSRVGSCHWALLTSLAR